MSVVIPKVEDVERRQFFADTLITFCRNYPEVPGGDLLRDVSEMTEDSFDKFPTNEALFADETTGRS